MGNNEMRINIVCVGKIKERYLSDGVKEYAKRLSRYCDFNIIECPEYAVKTQNNADITIEKRRESVKILENVKGYVILTAIEGKNIASEELAELIQHKMNEGVSEITFIIGGSNGVGEEVGARADYKISFGRATYPHQLMRVILAEQIYRAFSIINNLPYHK